MATEPRGMKRVGPRTKIGGKDLKIGDLVLFKRDDGIDILAQVSGAYKLGEQWKLNLEVCPGEQGSYRLPQSIDLSALKTIWGRGR